MAKSRTRPLPGDLDEFVGLVQYQLTRNSNASVVRQRRIVPPSVVKGRVDHLDESLPEPKIKFRRELDDAFDCSSYRHWRNATHPESMPTSRLVTAYERAAAHKLKLIPHREVELLQGTLDSAYAAYLDVASIVGQLDELLSDGLDCGATYLYRWDEHGVPIPGIVTIPAPVERCLDLSTEWSSGTPIPFDHQTGEARIDPAWLRIKGKDLLCRIWRDCKVDDIQAPLLLAFRGFHPRQNPCEILPEVGLQASLAYLDFCHQANIAHLESVYSELQWFVVARMDNDRAEKALICDDLGQPVAFHSHFASHEAICRWLGRGPSELASKLHWG